jgi:xanthine dehydrogenase YagR molybdenum-binding subunit
VTPRAQAPGDGQTAPGKRRVKVTKVENGIEQEEWIEVDDAAGPSWPARGELRLLNHDLERVDAAEKVTGRARYTHDVRLPGMVWARLLLAPVPAGSAKLDLAPARAVPGVVDAIAIGDGSIGFLGEPLAAVAAETPEAAEDGLRAIALELTREPFALTPEQALAEGAPSVTKRGNTSKSSTGGDAQKAEEALAAADAVIEASYGLPVQHHASLETHGVVVDYRGGDEATVYASTQFVHGVPEQAAGPLGLESSRVTAVVQHMGGGFGSKFELGAEGAAACELAKRLARPVHLLLTRRDEFLMAGNRSGARVKIRAGAKKDGTLTALVARAERHGGRGGGAFASLPYVYQVGASSREALSVYTHTDASRAMRAPGHPQASFPMESLIDELAYALGLDLLAVRKKNLADLAYHRQLDRAAAEIGWERHDKRDRAGTPATERAVGIGFGVSTWGGGGGAGCVVDVRIAPDGSVTASCGVQDLGTGARTLVAAIVAEALGLELAQVRAQIGRSDYPMGCASGGSVTTASLAPSVMSAAFEARQALFARVAEALACDPALIDCERGELVERGSGRRLSWSEACAMLGVDGLSARGTWRDELAANGVHGATAAKVEVDTSTGRVRVLEMVQVQDCGLPLNRLALRSQMNGGMIQALSYGLLEERVLDPWLGLCLSDGLEGYKIAGSLEMPAMRAIIDDEDLRPQVIGMAEASIIAGHSAIANAVHNACGARVRELPLTPDKVLVALEALRAGKKG